MAIMAKPSTQQEVPQYIPALVGRRFRMLRLSRGMTVTQWSEAIGEKCTPQKICNYEIGDCMLPIQYAGRACVLTGASFDYIYRGMVQHLPRELLVRIMQAEGKPPPSTRGGRTIDRARPGA